MKLLLNKNWKAEKEINPEAMIRHSIHVYTRHLSRKVKYTVEYKPRLEI